MVLMQLINGSNSIISNVLAKQALRPFTEAAEEHKKYRSGTPLKKIHRTGKSRTDYIGYHTA